MPRHHKQAITFENSLQQQSHHRLRGEKVRKGALVPPPKKSRPIKPKEFFLLLLNVNGKIGTRQFNLATFEMNRPLAIGGGGG